jgi:hypothetical protein
LIEYPLDVIRELSSLRQQAEKGVQVLAEAEAKQVQLTLAAEREEALAFLEAQGTVADRQAVAKLASISAREAAELAKVEVNRIKTKLKQLSEAQMAVQTSGRMVELQWKTAGVGER